MGLRRRASSLQLPLAVALAVATVLSSEGVVSAQQKFGINYGQIANDLPDPTRVAALLQSMNVNKVKLYDADPKVLTAFANTGVEFIIAVGNENLQTIASSPGAARQWVSQHVQPFIPATRITCVAVGNEVFTSNDTGMMASLVPAMKAIHGALADQGLDRQVAVTSAHSVNFLATSFPPSSGVFREDLAQYIKPMLDFHGQTGSPLLINAYPFFAYKGDPGSVSLPYVLFEPNPGVRDPNTNLNYDNMLYAQIDAVYAAMKPMGHTDVPVRISETGWPSKGDDDEVGATVQNAAAYNGNLMQRVAMNQGTPLKPDVPVDVYVFALFNEDMKPGPTSERNYGLFYPSGSPVYSIKASSGGGGGSNGIGPGGSFNDPYYTSMFSSSSKLAVDRLQQTAGAAAENKCGQTWAPHTKQQQYPAIRLKFLRPRRLRVFVVSASASPAPFAPLLFCGSAAPWPPPPQATALLPSPRSAYLAPALRRSISALPLLRTAAVCFSAAPPPVAVVMTRRLWRSRSGGGTTCQRALPPASSPSKATGEELWSLSLQLREATPRRAAFSATAEDADLPPADPASAPVSSAPGSAPVSSAPGSAPLSSGFVVCSTAPGSAPCYSAANAPSTRHPTDERGRFSRRREGAQVYAPPPALAILCARLRLSLVQ